MLRNNPQFRALLTLVQANPQILQPMLQELGKQNPQILRLIPENQAKFLHLINESSEGAEGLDVYIYDYFIKRNLQATAKAFQAEGKVSSDPVGSNQPRSNLTLKGWPLTVLNYYFCKC